MSARDLQGEIRELRGRIAALMDEAARLLTLLALVGGALTMVGAAFAYFLDETRRIRRTLTEALGAVPQPMLVARGRGVGVGFDLTRDLVAVAWDRGGWRLNYRLEELVGAELGGTDGRPAGRFIGVMLMAIS